jgi:hypothetical protein
MRGGKADDLVIHHPDRQSRRPDVRLRDVLLTLRINHPKPSGGSQQTATGFDASQIRQALSAQKYYVAVGFLALRRAVVRPRAEIGQQRGIVHTQQQHARSGLYIELVDEGAVTVVFFRHVESS